MKTSLTRKPTIKAYFYVLLFRHIKNSLIVSLPGSWRSHVARRSHEVSSETARRVRRSCGSLLYCIVLYCSSDAKRAQTFETETRLLGQRPRSRPNVWPRNRPRPKSWPLDRGGDQTMKLETRPKCWSPDRDWGQIVSKTKTKIWSRDRPVLGTLTFRYCSSSCGSWWLDRETDNRDCRASGTWFLIPQRSVSCWAAR